MDHLRCPCGHRTGPARESSMSLISCGTRTEPVLDPQVCRTAPLRTRKKIYTTRICKNPARESYVAVRDPYGPLAVLTPAVQGKAKFVQRCTGPVRPLRSQWVDVRILFKTAREQPVRGRECDVTGALWKTIRLPYMTGNAYHKTMWVRIPATEVDIHIWISRF